MQGHGKFARPQKTEKICAAGYPEHNRIVAKKLLRPDSLYCAQLYRCDSKALTGVALTLRAAHSTQNIC